MVVIFATIARSAPPPGADPALAPWYRGLLQPGTGGQCCSLADCRPVRTRPAADGTEAWVGRDAFPGAPDAWVPVPDDVVLRGHDNPTGEPVLCWFAGRVRCFVPGAGT